MKATPLNPPTKWRETRLLVIVILLLAAALPVWAQDGVPVSQMLRQYANTVTYNQLLSGYDDTTDAGYQTRVVVANWPANGFGLMSWLDSVSTYNPPDSVFAQLSWQYVPTGSWTSWVQADTIIAAGGATLYCAVAWPSSFKPYAVKVRFTTKADSSGDRCYPHTKAWGW